MQIDRSFPSLVRQNVIRSKTLIKYWAGTLYYTEVVRLTPAAGPLRVGTLSLTPSLNVAPVA